VKQNPRARRVKKPPVKLDQHENRAPLAHHEQNAKRGLNGRHALQNQHQIIPKLIKPMATGMAPFHHS
jgi:hypothetical protein